jgi:hypothetical protein
MRHTQQTPTTTATGIAVETDEHPLTDTDPATASPPDPAQGVLRNFGLGTNNTKSNMQGYQ